MPNRIRTIAATVAATAAATAVILIASVVAPSGVGGSRAVEAAPAATAGPPPVAHYFGRGAFDAIRQAVAATPRACGLDDNTLTALVLAPIFKEVSMAETPDAVPSPMTLSRWDEWTGVRSGGTNLDANYGLYAFRDPATPFRRAYWHPGVGIFQYDPAGVGAPFSAADQIDIVTVTRDVAAGMAQRYCGAGGGPAQRRAAAWQPWGVLGGIAKSEALFGEILTPGLPPFARIGLVDGVERAGGMVRRNCVLDGARVPCYVVDPDHGQGARWWATDQVDGGAVASGMAPLSAPFYVVERNGFEERHWLAEDTGYPIDIAARRRLGHNARPRDGQPGSGLEWFDHSSLCDQARPKMGCAPPPKAPPAKNPAVQPAKNPAAAKPAPTKPALEHFPLFQPFAGAGE